MAWLIPEVQSADHKLVCVRVGCSTNKHAGDLSGFYKRICNISTQTNQFLGKNSPG